MIIQELECPHCKSKEIVKRGFIETDFRGKLQRYGCKTCKQRFILDNAFFRMRNKEQVITQCIDMYYSGMSLRKIAEHLQKFFPNHVHPSTIYRWLIKYVFKIAHFTDKLNINAGRDLESDEMEYHRLGEKNWFIDVIDSENRFIVSSDYVQERGMKELIKVLKTARKKTGEKVKQVSTDGLLGYPSALKKTFNLKPQAIKNPKFVHRIIKSDSGNFNWKIERLHNSIRERTKIMRGFHGCVSSAKALMKGYEIYYNYIRTHQGIEMIPSDKAIPSLQFQDKNRWLELINLGHSQQQIIKEENKNNG